jgi:uncharacterized protein with GYD domain
MRMLFVSLGRLRTKPSKEFLDMADKTMKNPPPGVKVHNVFWTLGRYDIVIVHEAPSEKEAMKMGMQFVDHVATETLVAITREEALKLMQPP